MSSEEQIARRLERRRATRFPCAMELEMEWGSALLRGRIRDISASGMFIESSDPLWVGAGFSARLVIDRPVQIDCFVRRVEPGRGMGVTVTVPRPENRRNYEELLKTLSQGAAGGGQ